MPYLNVKLSFESKPGLSPTIARGLTDIAAEVLGKKRELTAVVVEYLAARDWFIGGSSLEGAGQPSFFLQIKITAGTNTKDEKALFVARAFAFLDQVVGGASPVSYVVIDDVHGDAWGYAGLTQEHRYVVGKSTVPES